MTCSAWPSTTPMTPCTRSSSSRRRARAERADEPVLAQRVDRAPLTSSSDGSFSSARGSTFTLQRGEQLAQQAGEVRAQPRHARELHRVRDLVEGDPRQQLLGVGVQARAPPARCSARRTAAARRDVGIDERELVLAEHALGEIAGQRARLDGQQHAGGRARRRRRAAPPPASLSPSGSSIAPIELTFAAIQSGRCDRLGRRAAAPPAAGRCTATTRARRRRRSRRGRRAAGRRRGVVGPAAGHVRARDGVGDSLGERTIEHAIHHGEPARSAGPPGGATAQATIERSCASASGVRAATTRECGSMSSGAPSGSSKRGERDERRRPRARSAARRRRRRRACATA